MGMFVNRFYDVLLSVYLYNERNGYTYLDQLQEAFTKKYPGEKALIASIRKHAKDERKHYRLFKKYFLNKNRQPLSVGRWLGYCDQMVKMIFGKCIDQLEPKEIIADDKKFFQLCRLIMITEKRGMKQVQRVLQNPLVKKSQEITKIFSIIEKDEPSHFYPYKAWLNKHNEHEILLKELFADFIVHHSLVWVKLPIIYFNPFLQREKLIT